MKIKLALGLIILTNFLCYSQNLPEITPPSPTASSLAQFADVPVSNYTGLPDINVPIYTVKSGDLTVPITLQYHGGGIKAAQEASWVGLGWSLNAGGTISRMIRGNDDLNINSNGSIPYISSNDVPNWDASEALFYLYRQQVHYDKHDPEPDLFYYNFGSFSGKFVLEKPENITDNIIIGKPVDAQAVRIRYFRSERKWIIADSMGNEYLFSVEEATQSYGHVFEGLRLANVLPDKKNLIGNASPFNTSTWYLEKISSPISDHVISFEYETNFHKTRSQNSFREIVPISLVGGPSGSDCNSITPFALSTVSVNSTVTNDVYLSKINFSNGYIQFNTSDRVDMASIDGHPFKPQKLDNISVYNNLSASPIVTANLDYDYFSKSSTIDTEYHRLKLESIIVNDQNYQFDYKEPQNVPSKMTLDIDHWGYFNNAQNGNVNGWYSGGKGTLIPTRLAAGVNRFGGERFYHPDIFGANREPSEEFTKSFVLEKITLPTGGTQTFNWESNKYFSAFKTVPATTSYSLVYGAHPPFTNTMASVEKEFEVNNAGTMYVNILIQKMSDYVPSSSIPSNHPSVIYYKWEDNQWVNKGALPYLSYIIVYHNDDVSLNLNYDNISLGVGRYKMVMSHQDNLRTSLNWSFVGPAGVSNLSVPGSGLRIGSIVFNDGIKPITKKYDYLKENSTVTSGIAADDPTYDYSSNIFGHLAFSGLERICGVDSGRYIVGDSNNLLPLSITGDNYTGYSRVRTFYEGDKEEGETISEFYNFKPSSIYEGGTVTYNNIDYYDPGFSIIYVLPNFPTESDPKNGKLFRKTIKNADGITVDETNYTYITDVNYRFNTLGLYTQQYPWKFICNPLVQRCITSSTIYVRYNNYADWCYLASETHTRYDLAGNNPVTKKTNYSYENKDHLQLTKTETIKSDGNRVISKMIYPDDIITPSTLSDNSTIEGGAITTEAFNAVKRLKNPVNDASGLHRIGQVIQTTTYEDVNNDGVAEANELLSLTRTNFKDNGNGFILPKNIQTLKGTYNSSSNFPQERITFQEYYANGNLKEVSKKDGSKTLYVWGYNDEYPVAKIENTTYDSIENLPSFGANFSIFSGLSSTQESELRGLSGTLVTTYKYKPLVGVSSITDPKGYTIYYEYDNYNRIIEVRDADFNILSENKYHYKGQP